ncbi:hypothetical protein B0909_14985 [Rhizobium rhizogenes]|nr:hypothetical protein B0909_14985 [Rhizobium rhizogenes]
MRRRGIAPAYASSKDRIFRRTPSPSFLCSSQESSRRASARRKTPLSPMTWAGWIPVTSTGMRKPKRHV